MPYNVIIPSRAHKQINELPKRAWQGVRTAIDLLIDDPMPRGACKLIGQPKTWRIRVGDYRILYKIEDDQLIILIVAVGHRKDIYR